MNGTAGARGPALAWALAVLLLGVTASGGQAQTQAPAQAKNDPRAVQRSALELQLQKSERDLDSARTPWPVVTMIAGVAIGLGAGIAGAAIAGGCETDDCSVSAAVGGLVVGGVGILTAGVIWWRLQLQRVQRLESKRYQLERDLERLKLTEPTPTPKDTIGAQWQFRF